MSDEHQHIIFKSLDNPARILFWNIDEFLLMALPFFIGVLLSSWCLMFSGFIVKYIYSKFYKNHPRFILNHILYWYLPTGKLKKIGLFKSFAPSHIRGYFR